MSAPYTPEQIADNVAWMRELIASEHGLCSCRENEVAALESAVEILEQIQAESAERLEKFNAAVAEAEELRDERDTLRIENEQLRRALEHIRHGASDRLESRNDFTMRGVLIAAENALKESTQ